VDTHERVLRADEARKIARLIPLAGGNPDFLGVLIKGPPELPRTALTAGAIEGIGMAGERKRESAREGEFRHFDSHRFKF
jgi:hypothetical protein